MVHYWRDKYLYILIGKVFTVELHTDKTVHSCNIVYLMHQYNVSMSTL